MRAIILSFEMHLAKGAISFPHHLQLGCSHDNTAWCASADLLTDNGIKNIYILYLYIKVVYILVLYVLYSKKKT